jgi:hypothetical protein
MRSIFVVLSSPLFDLVLSLLERLEPVGIQALFAEAGVEAFDKCVLDETVLPGSRAFSFFSRSVAVI